MAKNWWGLILKTGPLSSEIIWDNAYKSIFCKLKRSQKYMRLILCLGLIYRTTLESTSYLCLPNVAFLAGPFLSALRKLHSFSCEAFPTKTSYVAFPDGSGSLASLAIGSWRSLLKFESSTSR